MVKDRSAAGVQDGLCRMEKVLRPTRTQSKMLTSVVCVCVPISVPLSAAHVQQYVNSKPLYVENTWMRKNFMCHRLKHDFHFEPKAELRDCSSGFSL